MVGAKAIMARFISRLSPRAFFTIAYIHNRWRIPNFSRPKDLSEIWIRKILSGEINRLAWLADKYAVREYVQAKGLGNTLIPLLGFWDNAEDFKDAWETLPQSFALKMNFGAGMNIVVRDKAAFKASEVKEQLSRWLQKTTFSFSEGHYDTIPRKIMVEALLTDGDGPLVDYKFICLHGEPVCCLVCVNRGEDSEEHVPYSVDWQPLYAWKRGGTFPRVERPAMLEEMLLAARALAKEIDLCRIDLYNVQDKIYFGEITLTPAGAIFHNWSQKALDELGEMFRNKAVKVEKEL